MVRVSSGIEQHVDFVSQLNWSELLIGPCHVERLLSSDGRTVWLRLVSLTVDLTLKDASSISPTLLAKLFGTASQAQSSIGFTMDSSGTLYSGEAARIALETDEKVIELSEEQYTKLLDQTVEERLEKYKELAEYNQKVNNRQARRSKQRYGR